jgi:7-cyano-7-deazaguanine reductase
MRPLSPGEEIEAIAGRHLGRDGQGQKRPAYSAPARHDPGLLVAVPRALARDEAGIPQDPLPFAGADVWNAWECSFLLASGAPVSCVLTFQYPADSPNLVESKSCKLYLNSFNMERIKAATVEEGTALFCETVARDLSACVGAPVQVRATPAHAAAAAARPLVRAPQDWPVLEETVDLTGLDFHHDGEDPALLHSGPAGAGTLRFRTALLRSNCRITRQPDWGDLFVWMEGSILPSPQALLRYVVSLRAENHFHEEIVETVWLRLAAFQPRALFVAGCYTRRGGLDINPLRASSEALLHQWADLAAAPARTTLRQ